MGSFAQQLLLGLIALAMVSATSLRAEERAVDKDWRTGAGVAPGAMTWMGDNVANKKQLIDQTAKAQGKACTDKYAFLGWAIGNGGPPVIMDKTREGYEKAGYSVQEKPGSIDTERVWIVRDAAREAVILWGAFGGSTIYLSCITAGAPAANPEKPLWLAVLSGLGVGGLLTGWWLFRRTRRLGQAALSWPVATGVVKSSEIAEYKTKGGRQFMANVAYDYAVDGTNYSGNRLRFGHYAGAMAAAEADAAKYVAGAPVEVRYDPRKPQTSVLEPGVAGISVAGLVLAITGGLLLGVAVLIGFIE